ncbi:eukaryotic translation initiation factor 1-like [Patiria miniata]|uniref:SUI1 domain-containing protein n=1 Tax=Patiria miniata TaxID=46514 RepID=A0A913ZCE4_PATMI|nr:eukaryotic translation initiation factor 1-like [Patiria miniata]XP_038048745.1 eukaryotic translation initiation factor 1-like [Patiria miniata]
MAVEMSIENLKKTSAADDFQDNSEDGTMNLIHVRCQQRNGRKMITIVEGISPIYSQHRIVKKMKKFFNCNGNVHKTEQDFGDVIQLQGDQRNKVKEFLVSCELAKESQIKLHGV